jgi:hypothetical protein
VDTLLMLTREYGDTAAAKKVPPAIAEVFTAATKPYGAGKFCDSIEVLGYFAGLDAASVGKKIVADANTFRAKSLYECGMGHYRAKRALDALNQFDAFLTSYPKDSRVKQVQAAQISAEVGLAMKVTLPLPPPLGGNNTGSIPITFYNDSKDPVTVLIAGPTAHRITLPACPACPKSYPKNDPKACANLAGRPSVTLRLTPTTYYYTTESAGLMHEVSNKVPLQVNYEYTQCIYTSPS